jgi:CO/xanthine dehydrogenase FAD-binding subunit
MAALRLDVDKAGMISTIALSIGACSEVAMRMDRVEAVLRGSPLATACERITQDVFTELAPIDDVRAPAQYRREASVEVVRRLLADQQCYFANEVRA